jgi:antitoxin component HigA of HigAB toxin-antitoxin module
MKNRTRKKQLSKTRKLPVQSNQIHTKADHKKALIEIESLMMAELGTAEGERLDSLATLVGVYEKKHHPLKPRRKPVRPIPLDLSSEAGRRRVLEAAKRVMATHADVLAALARR